LRVEKFVGRHLPTLNFGKYEKLPTAKGKGKYHIELKNP
jgi:hypothetical protein